MSSPRVVTMSSDSDKEEEEEDGGSPFIVTAGRPSETGVLASHRNNTGFMRM